MDFPIKYPTDTFLVALFVDDRGFSNSISHGYFFGGAFSTIPRFFVWVFGGG